MVDIPDSVRLRLAWREVSGSTSSLDSSLSIGGRSERLDWLNWLALGLGGGVEGMSSSPTRGGVGAGAGAGEAGAIFALNWSNCLGVGLPNRISTHSFGNLQSQGKKIFNQKTERFKEIFKSFYHPDLSPISPLNQPDSSSFSMSSIRSPALKGEVICLIEVEEKVRKKNLCWRVGGSSHSLHAHE